MNSPANPTGALDDLGAAAAWGRAHDVPVFSDECYVEFTWDGPGRTILSHGLDGVVAVHSLSKRSNLAGVRVGFYAGDAELVHYLQEVRKHVGMLVPGPAQAAGVVALDDDEHVAVQRDRYRRRLERLATVLSRWAGIEVPLPRRRLLPLVRRRRRLGVHGTPGQGGRRAREPGRVLRTDVLRVRPRRRGTTGRPNRARGRAPGGVVMSYQPMAPPAPAPAAVTPRPKIKPSTAWYWIGGVLIALGVIGFFVVLGIWLAQASDAVDKFARVKVPPEGAQAELQFKKSGEYTLYYE